MEDMAWVFYALLGTQVILIISGYRRMVTLAEIKTLLDSLHRLSLIRSGG